MYKEILCNFDNIYKAYKIAHRGKTDDKEVIEFDKDKIYNLKKLQEKLLNKQWDEIFTYYRFVITDPKKRTKENIIKLLNPRKKSGKIKKIKEIFNEEPDKFWERFQSMRAYLRLGNTYYFRKKRLIYNYI